MIEVQDIFAQYGEQYLGAHMPSRQQKKAFDAIVSCRTAALGGHSEVCPKCGEIKISYNSCRNRHCPKCQTYRKEKWIEERSVDLLDIGYYHAVFTVPSELYPLFYANQRQAYGLLFRCAWETVREFAANRRHLGATTGATCVLHTWGRRLQYHPHVHMIIPAGGLTTHGTWKSSGKNFFAPVKAMSKVFRAKLLTAFKRMHHALEFYGKSARLADLKAFCDLISSLYEKEWVVYCKKPFKDAGCVLSYLGRYTHRVALSNSRIVSTKDGKVAFRYRDSRDENREKTAVLDAAEFIRRFLMHVLPSGFAKIRHYGIYASRNKNERIDRCKRLTNTPVTKRVAACAAKILIKMLGRVPGVCAACGCELLKIPLARPLVC
jgi:ribosomal protein L32